MVHEIPVNQQDRDEQPVIVPGVWIEHAVDPPEKRRDRLRNRNLPALLAMLASAPDDRARARIVLHVAQTYEGMADLEPRDVPGGEYVSLMATAMGWYMRRFEMGGNGDEVGYARMKHLVCAGALNLYSHREMRDRAHDLFRVDRERPETAYLLAIHTEPDGKRLALDYAREAVRLSIAAKDKVTTALPVDGSILWRSYLLAARCADACGIGEEARRCARDGVAAGGPRGEFAP
ncbi:MAG: hypothetical protein Q8S13_04995, partial [Dehalococcoidia bacterium]|nr:hypothetical protein [Dehalococcoidia bacterium]